jgi:hypothetical protein
MGSTKKAPLGGAFLVGRLLSDNVDCGADLNAAVKADLALRTEGDNAGSKRKKSVVLAKPYILAREHAGTALADDNLALLGGLSGIELNAQILRFRIG